MEDLVDELENVLGAALALFAPEELPPDLGRIGLLGEEAGKDLFDRLLADCGGGVPERLLFLTKTREVLGRSAEKGDEAG